MKVVIKKSKSLVLIILLLSTYVYALELEITELPSDIVVGEEIRIRVVDTNNRTYDNNGEHHNIYNFNYYNTANYFM